MAKKTSAQKKAVTTTVKHLMGPDGAPLCGAKGPAGARQLLFEVKLSLYPVKLRSKAARERVEDFQASIPSVISKALNEAHLNFNLSRSNTNTKASELIQ